MKVMMNVTNKVPNIKSLIYFKHVACNVKLFVIPHHQYLDDCTL